MRTPTILRALKLKGLGTAAVSSWRPFNTLVEGDADLSMSYACDDKVTAAACQLLADVSCPGDASVGERGRRGTGAHGQGFSQSVKPFLLGLLPLPPVIATCGQLWHPSVLL